MVDALAKAGSSEEERKANEHLLKRLERMIMAIPPDIFRLPISSHAGAEDSSVSAAHLNMFRNTGTNGSASGYYAVNIDSRGQNIGMVGQAPETTSKIGSVPGPPMAGSLQTTSKGAWSQYYAGHDNHLASQMQMQQGPSSAQPQSTPSLSLPLPPRPPPLDLWAEERLSSQAHGFLPYGPSPGCFDVGNRPSPPYPPTRMHPADRHTMSQGQLVGQNTGPPHVVDMLRFGAPLMHDYQHDGGRVWAPHGPGGPISGGPAFVLSASLPGTHFQDGPPGAWGAGAHSQRSDVGSLERSHVTSSQQSSAQSVPPGMGWNHNGFSNTEQGDFASESRQVPANTLFLPNSINSGAHHRSLNTSCYKFNNKGGCEDKTCRFPHVCERCGSPNHGGFACGLSRS
jgi:hypothetical protein